MITFYKYQGTGNDFILLNNLANDISPDREQIKFLCDRRFGVGADGLMMVQPKAGFDFEMKYYNSDGNESTMCGNGGRCIVKFAEKMGLEKDQYSFLAIDGPHEAKILKNGWVELKMNDVTAITPVGDGFFLNTGSPHLILQKDGLSTFDVVANGRTIRNSPRFLNEGVNVNFVEQSENGGGLFVRTYERGVENETLSCGTGVTAAALAFSSTLSGRQEVKIRTLGGDLLVKFYRSDDQKFSDIWLCGPAEFVFEGTINLAAEQ